MEHTISVAGHMRIVFSTLLVLCAAGCAREPASSTTSAAPPEGTVEVIRIATKQTALASLDSAELKRLAQEALRDQRIYSPAGNNALEYYIALRNMSSTADESTTNALSYLLPYAVIAAEQAIFRADFPDAERLHLLIAAADPAAPSLERIAAEIDERKRLQEAGQATRWPSRRSQSQERSPTQSLQPSRQFPPPYRPSRQRPVPSRPPVSFVAPAPAVPVPAPSTATETASVSRNSSPETRADQLVAIRAVQPAYPKDELRYGTVVSVTATFTVNADGSVGDVQLQGGGAAFARSIRAALRRWQFHPLGESMVVTRQFKFSP
jgi:protein TonB